MGKKWVWVFSDSYVLTLCRPMMKATLRLHGFMKLDQLVSKVTWSPFWQRRRTGEWSNGDWPAYFSTTQNKKRKFTKRVGKMSHTACRAGRVSNTLFGNYIFVFLLNPLYTVYSSYKKQLIVPYAKRQIFISKMLFKCILKLPKGKI